MTEPVPSVPDPDDLDCERDVVGVYHYWDGDVLYCVVDGRADGRWVAVDAGVERSLEACR